MSQSLFDRVGGFAQVRQIVSAFYDKILDSEALQHYFAEVPMPRLIDHQTQFIASVMGGPASFTDETLSRVHQPLGISHTDFKEMVALLRETLEDFDVAPSDVDLVARGIVSRESYIVSR